MKYVLCITFIFLGLHLFAQKSLNDSLKQRIDSLESLLKEKNYSRIPIGDFDRTLDVRVQSEVSNTVNKYLIFLSVLLFGGAFGVYNILKGELKSQVESAVKDNNEANKNQLKEMAEIQNRENGRQDVMIKTLTDSITSLSAKQDSFAKDVSTSIEKKITEATQTFWNDFADNKLRIATEAGYKGGAIAKELNEFIDSEVVKIGIQKKQRLVDTLMRCMYNTSEAELKQQGYGNKYDEMIKLIKKHETTLDLLPETYANAAIALNNNYEYYRNAEDKRLCLDCCDKAILKMKDYGIPFVLKLELYCMDYKNAFDEKERQDSLEQIKRTFHIINSSQSEVLFYEAVQRLQIDEKVNYLVPYIRLLETLCQVEILTLKEKAMKFLISRNAPNSEIYKSTFFKILEESYIKNESMAGEWIARKFTKAGIETESYQVNTRLSIDKYAFVFIVNNVRESGYVHFLNFEDKLSINFYFFNTENQYIQTAYSICRTNQDGSWTLCSNYTGLERPADFLSSADNKFYLEEFVKA